MNYKELQFAKVLADTCSFGRTAEICCSTQPTVSNAIHRLEDELGGQLFIRSTRRVELTAFGEYLLPWIQSSLSSRDELVTAAKSFGDASQAMLRIGMSPLVDTQFLNQLVANYRSEFPNTELYYKECFLNDLSDRIKRQTLDIAIVPACNVSDYENRSFAYEERIVFMPQVIGVPRDYPESICIDEVAGHSIILTGGQCGLNDTIRHLFEDSGVKLNAYKGHAMSYRVIEEWTELGIGAGLLPQRKVSSNAPANPGVRLRDNSFASVQYYWVWNNFELAPTAVTNLIDSF